MTEHSYRHVRVRSEDGVLVVTITPAELHTEQLADAIRTELSDAVARAGRPPVALDLGPVQFLASPGLRLLLNFRRQLREQGVEMLLCNVAPLVAEVFAITRLAGPAAAPGAPLGMAADVPAAVRALRPPKTGA